jgi:hypothetical protein
MNHVIKDTLEKVNDELKKTIVDSEGEHFWKIGDKLSTLVDLVKEEGSSWTKFKNKYLSKLGSKDIIHWIELTKAISLDEISKLRFLTIKDIRLLQKETENEIILFLKKKKLYNNPYKEKEMYELANQIKKYLYKIDLLPSYEEYLFKNLPKKGERKKHTIKFISDLKKLPKPLVSYMRSYWNSIEYTDCILSNDFIKGVTLLLKNDNYEIDKQKLTNNVSQFLINKVKKEEGEVVKSEKYNIYSKVKKEQKKVKKLITFVDEKGNQSNLTSEEVVNSFLQVIETLKVKVKEQETEITSKETIFERTTKELQLQISQLSEEISDVINSENGIKIKYDKLFTNYQKLSKTHTELKTKYNTLNIAYEKKKAEIKINEPRNIKLTIPNELTQFIVDERI